MAMEAPARARRPGRRVAAGRSSWATGHPFAAEVLGLYLALLDVQEPAFLGAGEDLPPPGAVAGYVAAQVLPRVVKVTAGRSRRAGRRRAARAGRGTVPG